MPDEAVIFVVERSNGREHPSIVYGELPADLNLKLHDGKPRLVYAWRLDKLPNGDKLAQMPLGDLYDQFVRMRAENKLPPSNLADPPRQTEGGQKGIERGPEHWWKPLPLPRGQDWTPPPPAIRTIGFEDA